MNLKKLSDHVMSSCLYIRVPMGVGCAPHFEIEPAESEPKQTAGLNMSLAREAKIPHANEHHPVHSMWLMAL